MKENRSYLGRTLKRSVGLDARTNAHKALASQGTPSESAIFLSGLLGLVEIAAPATGRAIVKDVTSEIGDYNLSGPFKVAGGILFDSLLWTIQMSTAKSLPILIAERAGTNVGVHVVADGLRYGGQKIKSLFKSKPSEHESHESHKLHEHHESHTNHSH